MRQQGFALVLSVVLLPAIAALLVWLSQSTHLMARFEGHQVADRVAYAAASQLATEFNAMAVLNRRILASHLMVAHLTSYLSFTRYLKNVLDRASYLVPYANQLVTGGTSLLVSSAKVQLQAGIGVALATQHQWAFDVVSHLTDGGSRIREAAQGAASPLTIETLCVATLCQDSAFDAMLLMAMPVMEAHPSVYVPLVEAALNGLPQAAWHQSRAWQTRILGILQARRSGRTMPDMTGRGFMALDELDLKLGWGWFGTRWRTIAQGDASTLLDGFVYRGLPLVLEWRGPNLFSIEAGVRTSESGQVSSVARTRFMSADADLWRPIWRSELVGARP
jgi:hypothetical protein